MFELDVRFILFTKKNSKEFRNTGSDELAVCPFSPVPELFYFLLPEVLNLLPVINIQEYDW
jgi:hypothetical protein